MEQKGRAGCTIYAAVLAELSPPGAAMIKAIHIADLRTALDQAYAAATSAGGLT